ncbi:glycosyltransferase [Pseudorhodobacter ferrugineus]|uniref:glycosyltransferase n=1 Tax=Pseudorhodobacter ferrugineus TaxID=77008 RepID=UPI0003B3A6E8|nr:glycosyltransferase [Pseudorhodobacter ferrugineus]
MAHIALFLPSLRGGGAERVMVTLANGFAARGHRVDLVLARAEGPYLSEVADNVRIVDLDKGRVLASLLPLARYLRRERPDAMLSALNHANIIAILARKLSRTQTRLVVSEHSTPSQSLRGSGMNGLLRRLISLAYPWADKIVCVSKGMEKEMHSYLGLPKHKLETIYNPIDIDKVQSAMVEPVDHSWFTNRDAPVILAVGRLTKAKDYPTLLAAFAQLRMKRPANLIILGHGEEKDALSSLADRLGISANVDFAGFKSNPYAWMAKCDLYVMSSAWEGLPGVLLEAMACGAKIVSTDCRNGPTEILEGGRWGRLVPVADASALAKAITEALEDETPPNARARAQVFRSEESIESHLFVLTR